MYQHEQQVCDEETVDEKTVAFTADQRGVKIISHLQNNWKHNCDSATLVDDWNHVNGWETVQWSLL